MRDKKIKKLSIRILLTCNGFSFILSLIIGFVGFATYYRGMMQKYQEYLTGIIHLASDAVVEDDMEMCIKSLKKSSVYEETQQEFNRLREHTNIEYLYLIVPKNENELDNMMYVMTGTTKEEKEKYGDSISLGDYSGHEYPIEVVKQYKYYMKQGDGISFYPNHTEFGYMYTGVMAISNSEGKPVAALSADISMNEVYKTMALYVVIILIGAGSLTTFFLFLLLCNLNHNIAIPINQLAECALNFVHESRDAENPSALQMTMPEIHTGDEIERLAESLMGMSSDIRNYMDDLSRVVSEKERIQTELNVATQIQADMLPGIFPAFPQRPEFDIYATMNPAKEVGGDFYDFFLIDENHLAVVMADVSGKGVPAALFMVIAKTLIKNHAQNGEQPSEVFSHVNRQLCESNEAGLFVTAWMGIMEINTGRMTYVNAGHNPPLICRKDASFEYLKCKPGFVLAGLDNMKYTQAELEFHQGDILYLYTDGVTEAEDVHQELYGEERLKYNLNMQKENSLEEMLRAVKIDIDNYASGVPQFDDITMLALQLLTV
ncbi:MAG: PP2C family protein-serine/threonine phosphatase [Clostridium sp.]